MKDSYSKLQVFLLLSIILILFFIFKSTIISIFEICYNDDDYSHGLLLPFISVYLLSEKLGQIKLASKFSNNLLPIFIGICILLVGIIIYLLAYASNLLYPSWLSLFVLLLGIMTILLPYQLNKIIAPPILLIFMAQPIPRSIIPSLFNPLQELAALISAKVLENLNVPIFLNGNIIELPNLILLVEEACSGIRSLLAILTVALIVIILFDLKFTKSMIFLIIATIVAIVLNIFRVVTTGVLAHFYDKDIASGFLHSFSGLIVFFVALFLLYWIGLFLIKTNEK